MVLDAGAFLAVERADRAMLARLRVAERHHLGLRTSGIIIGQVWRDSRGRQARLASFLRAVDVRPVDRDLGREAGALIGRAGTSDPMDATVVLICDHGDRVLTSDPDDIQHLVSVAHKRCVVVAC
jgi:hypothetical protein